MGNKNKQKVSHQPCGAGASLYGCCRGNQARQPPREVSVWPDSWGSFSRYPRHMCPIFVSGAREVSPRLQKIQFFSLVSRPLLSHVCEGCLLPFSSRRHPQSLFCSPRRQKRELQLGSSPRVKQLRRKKDGIVKLKEETAPECANLAH